MPILYFANSPVKKKVPVAEAQQFRPRTLTNSGSGALDSGLSTSFWHPAHSWIVKRADLLFSSDTSKTHTLSILAGRGVITGLNDTLWLTLNNAGVAIVIPQGFYNGTTLSAAIQTAINANAAFVAAGVTCAVAYANDRFTITPNTGTIGFVSDNGIGSILTDYPRNSTAGVVIGFLTDKANAASLQSDTAVSGLGLKFVLSTATGTATSASATDVALNVDQALGIDVSRVPDATANWNIAYQEE